jgi:hypothetical protein
MATNRLVLSELDFDSIKQNLKDYLKQQSEFTDYDFEGSGLSVLLDVLAYNTHYNAYYLNMVANESFLDTAILRESVISHAKTLGYTPHSVRSARAVCNVTVTSGSTSPGTLTIPRGFTFLSESLNNTSYNFIVLDDVTVTKSNTSYNFENLEIFEGQYASLQFTQDNSSNPKQVFVLPDPNIDTTTLKVSVRPSSSNTDTSVYNKVTDILDIGSSSEVYFLQETRNGKFQIYFGDDVVGKKLGDGSVISISYVISSGSDPNGASGFIPATSLSGLTDITVSVVSSAAGGSERESVDSVKSSAISQFATQNRLVTFKDYESYIKQNYPALDSISVWGGEEQTPPVYGKVFVSIKPKANYYVSESEKQRIIDDIITPKSIVAVQTEIVDPEYLYLLVNSYVKYDSRKTVLAEDALKTAIRNAVLGYRDVNLNKFGATFVLSKLQDDVDATSLNSIIGSEVTVRLQKRFLPTLNTNKSYIVYFNSPLHRGTISNRLNSTSFNILDSNGVERTVSFEEVAQAYSGISSISVTNSGSGYTQAPTVTITGDGTGATAEAVIVNGKIEKINVLKRGINYTRAIVSISGGNGSGAAAIAVIDARTGQLSTIYYDSNAEKQIVNENAGTIDYDNGILNISDIRIRSVSSTDGYIRIDIESERGIVESIRNTIITIDENDTSSITTDLVKV